ncbi:hypothetical protein GGI11_006608, partial [Coemansia sp. RSA 2049]
MVEAGYNLTPAELKHMLRPMPVYEHNRLKPIETHASFIEDNKHGRVSVARLTKY